MKQLSIGEVAFDKSEGNPRGNKNVSWFYVTAVNGDRAVGSDNKSHKASNLISAFQLDRYLRVGKIKLSDDYLEVSLAVRLFVMMAGLINCSQFDPSFQDDMTDAKEIVSSIPSKGKAWGLLPVEIRKTIVEFNQQQAKAA